MAYSIGILKREAFRGSCGDLLPPFSKRGVGGGIYADTADPSPRPPVFEFLTPARGREYHYFVMGSISLSPNRAMPDRAIKGISYPSPQPSSTRLIPVDALRGLIMIFMALDHASYFIARVHQSDWWGIPLSQYSSSLAFLTRFVTHPCAPGFFFLLGLSMAFFAESRHRLGWPDGRIRRYFLRRGLILIGLQIFAENIAWALVPIRETGPGVTTFIFLYLGVLYALGTSMIICGWLLRLRTSILMGAGVAAVLMTQFLTPGAESVSRLYHPLLRAILIPGQTSFLRVKYPVIPWLGVALLGMALGRRMTRDPKGAFRLAFLFGAGALVLFPVVRFIGWPVGDFHPPADSGWIAFLNLTKYPPSLAFILVTLGIDLVLLAFLSRKEEILKRWGKPLLAFGRTALFFYIVHLYVYGLTGLAFPKGVPPGWMYLFWLGGLVLLCFLCSWYARFKAQKAPDSIWRMF